VYRFTHSLYYANAAKLQDEVLMLTRPSASVADVWRVCVDFTAIDDVDFTGGATLYDVASALRERKIELVLANVSEHVRTELDRSGVTAVVGPGAYLGDLTEARRPFEPGRSSA